MVGLLVVPGGKVAGGIRVLLRAFRTGLGLILSHLMLGSTSSNLDLLTVRTLPVCWCRIQHTGPLTLVTSYWGSQSVVKVIFSWAFKTTVSPGYSSPAFAWAFILSLLCCRDAAKFWRAVVRASDRSLNRPDKLTPSDLAFRYFVRGRRPRLPYNK